MAMTCMPARKAIATATLYIAYALTNGDEVLNERELSSRGCVHT